MKIHVTQKDEESPKWYINGVENFDAYFLLMGLESPDAFYLIQDALTYPFCVPFISSKLYAQTIHRGALSANAGFLIGDYQRLLNHCRDAFETFKSDGQVLLYFQSIIEGAKKYERYIPVDRAQESWEYFLSSFYDYDSRTSWSVLLQQ